MAKRVRTTSEDGFSSTTEIRDYSIAIDPSGEDAPDTLEMLLATYAACYTPALRVGADQRGVGDLGHVEFEVTGDLNEDDKLAAIAFEITTDTEIDAESAAEIIDRANQLCKVHDAVKSSLKATISLNGHDV